MLLIGFEISCFGFFKVDSFVCELLERFVEVCFVFVVRSILEIVCRLHQNKGRSKILLLILIIMIDFILMLVLGIRFYFKSSGF